MRVACRKDRKPGPRRPTSRGGKVVFCEYEALEPAAHRVSAISVQTVNSYR